MKFMEVMRFLLSPCHKQTYAARGSRLAKNRFRPQPKAEETIGRAGKFASRGKTDFLHPFSYICVYQSAGDAYKTRRSANERVAERYAAVPFVMRIYPLGGHFPFVLYLIFSPETFFSKVTFC